MKLVSLLSGGIDSPVATYLMSKIGAEVILLHMDNGTSGDQKSIDKLKDLAQILRDISGQEMPLYFAPHDASMNTVVDKCNDNYKCVMCKRIMQRVAREFGKKMNCDGIIMGDSLGQVASQTLKNIKSENIGLNFPVARPLIGYDKLEIEAIGKEIGTYEISIRQTPGCAFVPLKPITEADPELVQKFDSFIDLDKVVSYALNNTTLIE